MARVRRAQRRSVQYAAVLRAAERYGERDTVPRRRLCQQQVYKYSECSVRPAVRYMMVRKQRCWHEGHVS